MNRNNQALFITLIAIFAVMLIRLVQLQLIEGSQYHEIALKNAAKNIPAAAPRGVIYDRDGKVVVDNRPIFSVEVLPQLLTGDPAKRDRVLGKLGQVLGEKIDFKVSAQQPIIVRENISLPTAIKIEEMKDELEGVLVKSRPIRFYPYSSAAAHLLGYVGEIAARELENYSQRGYRRGDVIGKDGVERYYDQLVRGIDGGKQVEVNVYGEPIRILSTMDPIAGANISLTIDTQLQEALERALGAKAGAAIVTDPNTGQLLALSSHPNYDPNLFIGQLDMNKWEKLARGRHPFMNRALAIYPPGSIFKVVTLIAALEEGITKPNEPFYCPGYYKINDRIAKCWKESGHGQITAEEGLVQSCDVVFYELGRRLGPEKIAKYARLFGLGDRTGIDLPQEKRGLVPDTEWKKKIFGEQWYDGDSINYAIGQGFLQVTPIQMAGIYGAIATGKRMRPYVVKQITKRNGEVVYQPENPELGPLPFKSENLAVVRRALVNVVDRATGRVAKIEDFPAAGKTGTAQTPGLPHAWFLCYAPVDQPRIVVAAFVEHGEHGDRAAASVARDILAWYKEHRIKDDFDKAE